MKILPFFAGQLFDELLSFIEGHCIHFGFDQGHSATFGLASFICCFFFLVEVNEVGFCPCSPFSLLSGAVSHVMSFFSTGEAVKHASLSGIGYIGPSSPLTSCVSSSSCPPVIL
jgi:hypothetical protein